MEAPEKIYIDDPTGEFNDNWSIYQNNISIEYTRTDAFIDKAWDWIEDNIMSINQRDESLLYLEQFKNYMKGE